MHLLPAFTHTNDDITPLLNRIHHADAFDLMKRIPDNSVDLIITSPPYNLRNSTGNGMKSDNTKRGKWANAALKQGYSNHNDNMPHYEYVKWQRSILAESMRVLKEDGAIFYNHKWRVQNGLLQDRQDIVGGFPVRQIIIWERSGGVNFNDGYFLPTYEVIYLVAKKNFKLAKGANSNGDIWRVTQDTDNQHPAPFPEELVHRIISSTNASIILDPFMGSGTTAIVANKLKRNFIGCDNAIEYVKLARERLQNSDPYQSTINTDGTKQLSLFDGVA